VAFTTTHDAGVTAGGSSGGGVGQLEVSCNGGSTWITLTTASDTIGGSISYSYNVPICSGVTNLDTLLFRAVLSGGGVTGFNMSFTAPSSVIINW